MPPPRRPPSRRPSVAPSAPCVGTCCIRHPKSCVSLKEQLRAERAAFLHESALITTPRQTPDGGSGRRARSCAHAEAVQRSSRCPSTAWLDHLANLLLDGGEATFVNVGANKGYNVAAFLERFHAPSRARGVSGEAWMRFLQPHVRPPASRRVLSRSGAYLCGACYDCMDPPPSRLLNASVRVLAIEAAAANANLLRAAFGHFGVPGSVAAVAVSNRSGTAYIGGDGEAGSRDLAQLGVAARSAAAAG